MPTTYFFDSKDDHHCAFWIQQIALDEANDLKKIEGLDIPVPGDGSEVVVTQKQFERMNADAEVAQGAHTSNQPTQTYEGTFCFSNRCLGSSEPWVRTFEAVDQATATQMAHEYAAKDHPETILMMIRLKPLV